MVAILTGIFGIEHLTLAEDVVQEALARALQTWPFYGVPANPSAWIMRASRNLALDVVRRDKIFREKEEQIIHIIEGSAPASGAFDLSDDPIVDDRLRMMFVCCHPLIPQEDQVALALKTLCGFSIAEISRAFLSSEAAVAKRLTRAKQNIRDSPAVVFKSTAPVETERAPSLPISILPAAIADWKLVSARKELGPNRICKWRKQVSFSRVCGCAVR